jgi:hypothetical protein
MLSVFVGCSGIFVQLPYLETSKIFKECGQGGVVIHLVRLYKVATTVCAETFIIDITVIVPGPGLSLHLMKSTLILAFNAYHNHHHYQCQDSAVQ